MRRIFLESGKNTQSGDRILKNCRNIRKIWKKTCEEACGIISSQKKLEDIMMDFLLENAKQIELFFNIPQAKRIRHIEHK